MYTNPKLTYCLILKSPNSSNSGYSKNAEQKVTIFADGYDISIDGAVTFFHFTQNIDKTLTKINVLSYPSNRWDNCYLLNTKGEMAAFRSKNMLSEIGNIGNIGNNTVTHQQNEKAYISQNEVSQTDRQISKQAPEEKIQNVERIFNPQLRDPNMIIPGYSNNQDNDYTQVKDRIIEESIPKYFSKNDEFDSLNFVSFIENEAHKNRVKISDSDVCWAISKLIKKKKIQPQKFLKSDIKKILDMHLPSVLKRHWDGPATKITLILEIVKEKDETKNINPIDLTAWLSINHYFDK